jgi:hypothetical protein
VLSLRGCKLRQGGKKIKDQGKLKVKTELASKNVNKGGGSESWLFGERNLIILINHGPN